MLLHLALVCYSVSAQTYTNPVQDNCADPGAIYVDKYYVACTGGGMAIYSSFDMVSWKADGEIFPNGQVPKWSNMNYWAPEIHQINTTTFNVYFTSNDKTNGNLLSIGVATASAPHGPYKDPLGSALVKGDSSTGIGYIDPNFFHDPITKQNYVLFKYDGNSKGVATPIYIQQVDAAGIHLIGSKKQLITDDQKWEHTNNGNGIGCIEAPWLIYNSNTLYYYLFYSGSMYNGNTYNIGVARSKWLMNGTFVKFNGPILHTRFGSPYIMDVNQAFNGPGHCSVLTQKNDHTNYVMLYASWKASGGNRNLMLDQIQWVDDWPRIFTDTPSQDKTTLVFKNAST
eukprot:171721_1